MKVLFLDIDGVVWDMIKKRPMVGSISNLNKIRNVKTVISSTWRIAMPLDQIKSRLESFGLRMDITDVIDWQRDPNVVLSQGKAHYIDQYVEQHDITDYVVLDDSKMERFGDRMIHVDSTHGVSDKDVKKIRDILSL